MLKKLIPALLLITVTLLIVSAGCTENQIPATPLPTTAPVTPEPTATAFVPAHLEQGGVLEINYNDAVFKVSIEGKRFGADAEEILSKSNGIIPEIHSNEIAVLLKIKTEYISGKDNSFIIDTDSYEVYVNGVGYDALKTILPNEYKSLTKTNILKGASYSGWLAFIVPTGDEDFGYDFLEEPLGFIKVNY